MGVAVGRTRVGVGGMGVAVEGTGVLVGGIGVVAVAVGGTGVEIACTGSDVGVACTGFDVGVACAGVAVRLQAVVARMIPIATSKRPSLFLLIVKPPFRVAVHRDSLHSSGLLCRDQGLESWFCKRFIEAGHGTSSPYSQLRKPFFVVRDGAWTIQGDT